MADGLYYNDVRAPFLTSDPSIAPVSLSTTNKALYTASNFPVLGGQYWVPGKKMKIRLFGRMTTAATPGNFQWAVYYGSGADANGTIIQSSTAQALQINQTAKDWCAEFNITCRTGGSTGTLFCTGWSLFNVGLILSTAQPILIPDNTAAVSGSLDLTSANIISVQANRSGSTAETMTIHDMDVIAMN